MASNTKSAQCQRDVHAVFVREQAGARRVVGGAVRTIGSSNQAHTAEVKRMALHIAGCFGGRLHMCKTTIATCLQAAQGRPRREQNAGHDETHKISLHQSDTIQSPTGDSLSLEAQCCCDGTWASDMLETS